MPQRAYSLKNGLKSVGTYRGNNTRPMLNTKLGKKRIWKPSSGQMSAVVAGEDKKLSDLPRVPKKRDTECFKSFFSLLVAAYIKRLLPPMQLSDI